MKISLDNKFIKTIGQTALISLITTLIVLAVLWSMRGVLLASLLQKYGPATPVEVATTITEEESMAEIAPTENTPATTESVESAVAQANPAVVAIAVFQNVPKYKTVLKEVSPFPGVVLQVPEQVQDGFERRRIGSGSGFIATSDGLIITNRHVVAQTNAEFEVTLQDSKTYPATVLDRDAVLDVAIVKIVGSGFPTIPLGNSDTLKLGQSVVAIGNALGQFKNTVSVGIVSGLSRSITAQSGGQVEYLDQVIQTDAAINPGNSGGPLLNLKGEVVGVNVAIVQGSQNIGFALPINQVKSALSSVQRTGKIVRPYLGIRYVPITEEVQEARALPVSYGVLLDKSVSGEPAVLPGSPAEKAGLKEGDIITHIDGVRMTEERNFTFYIREKSVGDMIQLQVLSGGASKTLRAFLAEAS